MIRELSEKNPHLNIQTSYEFSPLYRRLGGDSSDVIAYSEIYVPNSEENKYIPSDPNLENIPLITKIQKDIFDYSNIQAGWCFGSGISMNGMEWHKSSEVIIACTDMILFLGNFGDIKNDEYDSKNALSLFLKKGEIIELYPLTLHLAPIRVSGPFKAAIILPKGTNLPRPEGIEGNYRAINKWLIVHPENLKAVAQGAKVGIIGKNLYVNPIIEE